MKRLFVIAVISLATFMLIIPGRGQTQIKTTSHSEWVAKSLSAIQTIKVGMTRKDLLKLFTVEGAFP